MSGATITVVATPHGPARVHVHAPAAPAGALVLGHGAGGALTAPDLRAVTAAALAAGVGVALVEQPYRVAGRRSPAPACQLDAAWLAVLAHLRAGPFAGLALVAGGRSSGARVACRTAADAGVAGVLCLAFPLRPPPRRTGRPSPSRQGELDAVSVPVLVVQGAGDRFGLPPAGPQRSVVTVRGDHALKADVDAVATAAGAWLTHLLA